MIEIILLITAVIVFLLFLVLGYGIGTYNALTSGKVDIDTQFSNIKTEYQRRADMFMNLVEATKSYKKFEKETMIAVTEARQGNFGSTRADQVKKMSQLEGIFSKLFAVAESYPNLKSNEQHNKLMEEIRITEDRVNIARTDFNEECREYNETLKVFPSNVVANMFAFKEVAYFQNEAGTEKAVRINLE